eukprot:11350333-Heterocapsa_arctica.AAC.1
MATATARAIRARPCQDLPPACSGLSQLGSATRRRRSARRPRASEHPNGPSKGSSPPLRST